MSGLVTNGVARDVTTCHVVTSRHVTRPRDTPLSALRCQIVSAEEKWRRDPGSEIFTGPAGLLAPAPPSPAVLPPRGLICQTAGRCRAEQSRGGAMTLQPLLLFICSRQRDAATAGVVSGPSYPRHSYDPFCAITGYTVVTLPIIAFLPQPAPTQPQPRPRAHGDTGAISCRHCKLQTSPSPAHAACCAAGSQNLS